MECSNGHDRCCGQDRLLRLPEVIQMTRISKSTIDRKIKKGLFPQSVRLGPTSVAWWESEVLAWMADRPRALEDHGSER